MSFSKNTPNSSSNMYFHLVQDRCQNLGITSCWNTAMAWYPTSASKHLSSSLIQWTEHCSQGWLCVQKGELWSEQGVLLQAELDLLSGVPRQGRRWRAGSRATRWGEGFQMRAMLLSKCRYFELEKIHFFINTSLLWTLFFLCLNVVMITLFRCNFCLSKGHEWSPFYELWMKIEFINTA